jgi:diguanylate cyclase (GGDEF)-like protein
MGQEALNEHEPERPLVSAERDLIALGIAVAACILLLGTGGSLVTRALEALLGVGRQPDVLLVNALLLNLALMIFGWRRYRELTREIAERRRAEARARLLADTDPLTQCLNRRAMLAATEALRQRARARGEALAYCMIDLDNFKQINDVHGHAAGDGVLVMLCQRLRDLLPSEARLARLGGDEFAFVLPYPPQHPERIDDLVIRLFESMADPFRLPQLTVELTLSVGIAGDHDPTGAETPASDAAALMHRADMALYHAKKEGRNRFFWFDPSMEAELRFRHQLESGIRRGLARGEFVPFYEQQIDVETGALVGFEMLARWQSPQLGLVSPQIFVPIAEEIGLIAELSEQLMAKAFADAREWDESLTLAINISPVQLRDPWFAQRLLKLLVSAGFPPHRLEVEITEGCLHENITLVHATLSSLRNQGVRVSLDDFGTGYASLEQLRSLPFDRIKIDRNFVRELRQPGPRSPIIEAIITLGRGLDLPITAEGVEDAAILESLKSLGRLKAQGYLYGQPEDAEAVRARLAAAGKLAPQAARPPSGAAGTPGGASEPASEPRSARS